MQIEIDEKDAAQVHALCRTNAEMSRLRAMESEQLHGRVKQEGEDVDLLEDLKEQVDDFDEDAENLDRIAAIFQPK